MVMIGLGRDNPDRLVTSKLRLMPNASDTLPPAPAVAAVSVDIAW